MSPIRSFRRLISNSPSSRPGKRQQPTRRRGVAVVLLEACEGRRLLSAAPGLVRVVRQWNLLSPELRAAIAGMVDAAVNADREEGDSQAASMRATRRR